MKKTFFKVFGLLLVALFVFSGCEDKTVVSDVQEPSLIKKEKKQMQEPVKKEPQTTLLKKHKLSNILQDNASISAKGKYGLILFESLSCEYCNLLKEDILKSSELQKRLKEDFSTYALVIENNKRHNLEHQNKMMEVDTKTLIDIYSVQATPTLVFTDKTTKSIFVVPGYMKPKQFKVTLDFIESRKWEGLDRKNGDVYKALKKFYIEKGILKG